MLRLLGLVFALAVMVAVTGAAIFSQSLRPVVEDPAGAPAVSFLVNRGQSLGSIARRLEGRGLVRDARAVILLARWRDQATSAQAGEYELSAALSPAEILDRLASGKVMHHPVSIPEGLTAREIGARIAEAGLVDEAEFQAAVADAAFVRSLGVPADHAEGYLFPETYRMPRGLSGREVVRILVEHFFVAWEKVSVRAELRGLDMHHVVTLASIVEKETGASFERPIIASVFANRLARKMRLESDPTIIYGIPDFDGNLRRRDLTNAANPYNTYQHAGLTPGPIANPGLASLEAVVEPADTDFFFFVSRNDGTHHFSKTYREHNNMVNRYQRRRGAK